MKQKTIGMIAGVLGILALGGLHGYWIGTLGKRRSWSRKSVKQVAGFPLMVGGLVPLVASVLSRTNAAWAKFPRVITVTTGVLAMTIAAKVSHPGVPLSEPDRDNLSIR